LERLCSDRDETRLHLIVQSQSEQDNKQFDSRLFNFWLNQSISSLDICTQIRYDLISFENNDRPIYDVINFT
jgi:hypothetical protein